MTEITELDSRLDKEICVLQILRECGGLMPVYYEIEAFKVMWRLWFKVNKETITKLCNSTTLEYNPLENYRWSETSFSTKDINRTLDGTSDNTQTRNESYNDITTSTEDSHIQTKKDSTDTYNDEKSGTRRVTGIDNATDTINSTVEQQTSAYNETIYQPETKTIENGTNAHIREYSDSESNGSNTESTDIISESGTEAGKVTIEKSFTHNAELMTKKDLGKKHEGEDVSESKDANKMITGMNGNFTYQDLIAKERDLAAFNMYIWIAEKFKDDNCYRIY